MVYVLLCNKNNIFNTLLKIHSLCIAENSQAWVSHLKESAGFLCESYSLVYDCKPSILQVNCTTRMIINELDMN